MKSQPSPRTFRARAVGGIHLFQKRKFMKHAKAVVANCDCIAINVEPTHLCGHELSELVPMPYFLKIRRRTDPEWRRWVKTIVELTLLLSRWFRCCMHEVTSDRRGGQGARPK